MICAIPIFLFVVARTAGAYYVSEFLKNIEGVIAAYVNETVEVDDPDKIKMCFLSDAQNYQGVSVEELFDKPQPPMTGKVVLLAALFNIRLSQWIFLYADVW